jgi:3-isopropylmalate dehydrogenase
LLQLRKTLGLYSNIRPLKIYESLKEMSPLKTERLGHVDIEIYRELTGGIYFGEKELNEEGTVAKDVCTYSVLEIERIAVKAFQAAQRRRKKLTLIDKANVLETSRLWRKVVQRLSLQFPEVETNYLFVDNAAMQLILNPSQFDVILTENLFGDVLSDEASVISGSIGLLPSASIGDRLALFEPIHGSYPEATGKGIANPIAMVLSVAMMMDYFALWEEAKAIRSAVDKVIQARILTQDLNPIDSFSTSLVGDVIAYLVEDDRLSIEGSFQKMKDSRLTII